MIVTKSPVRISYCGGGSDFYEYFKNVNGCVVNAAITKYVYILTNPQPKDAKDRFRFTYRITESVEKYKDFQHPVVNKVLRNLKWKSPLNIATLADVPGNSGLGSSSAFTAGLLQNLYTSKNLSINKKNLAENSISVERFQLNEAGGWQDQFATVYGNFRSYVFSANKVIVSRPLLDNKTKKYLEQRQVLISTKIQKLNMKSSINFKNRLENKDFSAASKFAETAFELTSKLSASRGNSKLCYSHLVDAVNTSWEIKRALISDSTFGLYLDKLINKLLTFNIDAIKLLGSGDGGYLLVLANPSTITKITRNNAFYSLPISYDLDGTQTKVF